MKRGVIIVALAASILVAGFSTVKNQAFWAWWLGLEPEVQSSFIGASATLLVGGLGFLAVFIQIGRQAKHALEQTRVNEAEKLKLEIYRLILETCTEATSELRRFSGYLRKFAMEVENARSFHALRIPYIVPSGRFLEYTQVRTEALSSAIEVISVIERWHVIDSRMRIFKDAISAALFDIEKVLDGEFQTIAARSFPMNRPGTDIVLPWQPLSPEIQSALAAKIDLAFDAILTLSLYIGDFQTEMQALLVGGLFGGSVTVRRPIDPSAKVITLEDQAELRRYFWEDSPWGLNASSLLADVAGKFQMPAGLTEAGQQDWITRARKAIVELRKQGFEF